MVVTQQGTLELAASSEEQLLDWITAIDLILADNHARGQQNVINNRKSTDIALPLIPISTMVAAPIPTMKKSNSNELKQEKSEKKKGILRSNTSSKETKKKKPETSPSEQVMKSMGELSKGLERPKPEIPNTRSELDDENRARNQSSEVPNKRYSNWGDNSSNYQDYQSDYGAYPPIQPRMQLYDMYGHPVPQMFYHDYQMPPEEYYRMRNMRYDYPAEMDPRFSDPRYRMDFDPRYPPFMEDPRNISTPPREDPRYSGERFPSNDPRYISMQNDPRFAKDAKIVPDPRDPRFQQTPPRQGYPVDMPRDPRYPLQDPLAQQRDPRYPPLDAQQREPRFVNPDPLAQPRDPRYPPQDPYRQAPYYRRGPDGYPELYAPPPAAVYGRDMYGYPVADRPLPSDRNSMDKLAQRSSYYELNQRRDVVPEMIHQAPVSNANRRQSETSDDSQVFEGQKERVAPPRSVVRRSQSVRQTPDSQMTIEQQQHLERIQKIASGKVPNELVPKERKDPRKEKLKSEPNPKSTSVGNLKQQPTDRVDKIEFKKPAPRELGDRPKSISFADSTPSEEYERKKPQRKTSAEQQPSPTSSMRKPKTSLEEMRNLEPKKTNKPNDFPQPLIRGKSKEEKVPKVDTAPLSTSLSAIDRTSNNPKKSRLSSEIEPVLKSPKGETPLELGLKSVDDDDELLSSSKALSTISASIDISPQDGKIKQSQMINPEISNAFYEGGIEPEILDVSMQDLTQFNSLTRNSAGARLNKSHPDDLGSPRPQSASKSHPDDLGKIQSKSSKSSKRPSAENMI